MKDCIFCKIIKGEIPSFKVYEDDEYLAILDINPNTEGVTLVLSKEHLNSDIFSAEDSVINSVTSAAKKVSKKLKSGLGVERVGLVFEGMGIDHLHAKLYPLHGVGKDFVPMEHGTEKVFFDKYPGYLTTQLGKTADLEELEQTANKIAIA